MLKQLLICCKAEGNTYKVSSADELTRVLEQIGKSQETEATIVLNADIGNDVKFVGVVNKSITVKSTDGQKHALTLGSELVGDITLDNVKVTAGTLYCSGYRTIFTENCEFTISGTLYGGGNSKTYIKRLCKNKRNRKNKYFRYGKCSCWW